MSIGLSVVIPTYKDKVNRQEVYDIFTGLGFDVDLLVSKDDPHRGKGNALRQGLLLAAKPYILILDADLQIAPAEVKTFFRLMELYDADAVIGNKRHTYSVTRYTFLRRIISNCYNYLSRQMFGFDLRDTQCGFKLFKKKCLEVLPKVTTDEYAFDLELIVALRENDYRIVDAPVLVMRQKNRGAVSLRNICITFIDTLRIWVRMKRGFYAGISNNTLPR